MAETHTILCIGSANVERVVALQHPLGLGAKNDSTQYMTSAGGSALNQICRLLAMGFQVVAMFSVGDDEGGRLVTELVQSSIAKGEGEGEAYLEGCVLEGRSTASSVVVIDPLGRRTIISWAGTASGHFQHHFFERLDRLEHAPDAVIIGHISSDRHGHITRGIVSRFAERGSYIALNMGRTQYEQGPGAFLDVLGKVDCLQFELAEAKSFVSSYFDRSAPTIEDVMKWLIDSARSRSIVLTLAEAGALGCHRDSADELLIAWPYDLEGIIRDSTGAGDAFVAGLTSVMVGSDRGLNQFQNALAIARDWAAYACTTLGGAYDPPNKEDLEAFVRRHRERVLRPPERRSWEEARHILRYFDIARRYSLIDSVSSA
ncbi:MAG: carbohydrate kinase family protein [Anaerolineae bacterium]|nr:carbohydrate kinase family protein [Anaerolineae bacterium]